LRIRLWIVAEVDPEDDSVGRYIVRHYAYEPARHERRHQTTVAFDDRMEFEAYIQGANARLRALQAVDRNVDPLEYYSGVFKPAGEDHHQRLRRIAQAAIEHGARPPAEVVSELHELGEQISQSRRETL
jgi:hypothetical protein